MKANNLRIVLVAVLASMMLQCTSGFLITKNGTILGPTSVVGQQDIDEFDLDAPNGVHVHLKGYHTRNPDPAVTAAVVRYITVEGAVKILRDGYAYLKHLSDNKIALYEAGTKRQIGLVNANSTADVARLDAAARNATPVP